MSACFALVSSPNVTYKPFSYAANFFSMTWPDLLFPKCKLKSDIEIAAIKRRNFVSVLNLHLIILFAWTQIQGRILQT